jgi:CheY-like chemotaxis protein
MQDETRTVLAAVDDLFFAAKIQSVAQAMGIPLVECRTFEQLQARVASSKPDLVVLDLNSAACRPLETVRYLKRDPRFRCLTVIGFLSHVQTDLAQAAKDAGCDRVLPRSKFSARLAQILTGAE